MLLWLILPLLLIGGCSKSMPVNASASPRLHLVAVVYGKYVSAHEGEMPPDQQEFVKYVDSNEREVLQRYGLRSVEDIFTAAGDQPRIFVLYRDQKQRLQSDYVAIEEQKLSGLKTVGKQNRSKWFAADHLGVAREISEDEAGRLSAEADQAADKSPDGVKQQEDIAGDTKQ